MSMAKPTPATSITLFSDGSFEVSGEGKKRAATEATRQLLQSLKGGDLEKQPLVQGGGAQAPVYPPPYFKRWSATGKAPPPPPLAFVGWAVLGSFLGIAVLMAAELKSKAVAESLNHTQLIMLIGSFGAQAVLLWGAPAAPFAQPWNCVGGNAISATIGVLSWLLIGNTIDGSIGQILCCSIAVSFSIGAMLLARCLHPPGGATALIFAMGGPALHNIGFLYVLFPAITSSVLHVFLSLVVNNISSITSRHYPVYWQFWSK